MGAPVSNALAVRSSLLHNLGTAKLWQCPWMPQGAGRPLFNTITYLTNQLLLLSPPHYQHFKDNNDTALGTQALENFHWLPTPPLFSMSSRHVTWNLRILQSSRQVSHFYLDLFNISFSMLELIMLLIGL